MCHSCGDQPVVPRGLYCQDCREMKESAAKTRRKARERVQKGKPCAGCKRPKPIGRGLRYCKTCRRKMKGPRMCERQCGRPARSQSAHLCAECKAQAVEDRRTYGRLWMRENGHSQKGRGRKPDAIRMETRLKAERAGRTLELVDPARKKSGGAHSARIDAESFPRLPVAGFVATVDRLIVKERAKLYRLALMSFDGNDGSQGVVCKACGVTERRLTEWRNGLKFDATLIGPRFADGRFYTVPVGAGMTVSFDQADRFLTSSGLLWRDVWDGHEVCSNGRTVEWVFESTELLADAV